MTSPIEILEAFPRTNESSSPLVCFAPTLNSMHGIWHGEHPLDYAVPVFLLQLILITITTRASTLLLQRFHQPRYISDFLGGFVLGPTLLGRIPGFSSDFFPIRSILVLESISYLGLIYYFFTVGIETEPQVVRRSGLKAIGFAAACLAGPMTIATVAGILFPDHLDDQPASHSGGAFPTFLGVILSVTAFTILARILAELKLLGSDAGKLALSSAVATNSVVWGLLAVSLTLAQNQDNMLASIWTILSCSALYAITMAVMKPAVKWVLGQTPEGEDVDELYASIILVGVMGAALMADAIGTHAIFGAFVYGLAIPNGPLGEALIDKVEDVVMGLLLPLFFVLSGLRTNINSITDVGSAVLLILVVLFAVIAKVAGGVLAAIFFKMSLQDGLSVGLLMNAKGVIELVILNIGRDKKIIGEQAFTVLVFMSVIVTAMVSPLLNAVVRPSRKFVAYKRRTVRWPNPESELRVLPCVHTPRDVPALIALLDISHPTKRSPIFVYALHLVELTGRAATLLGNATALPNKADPSSLSRLQAQSEHIVRAFENYEQHAGGVSVQTLAAFSPYSTMHEDVSGVAEDKHVALILLPFHKYRTVDGSMEVTHPAIRPLNHSVLCAAPCSVAILVDRGLGAAGPQGRQVALLFFGGPDDREALAYAARMVGHPGIRVTVVRFLHGTIPLTDSPREERVLTVMDDRDRQMDEICIDDFRARYCTSEVATTAAVVVDYVEKVSCNAEETVAGLREMEGLFDLYIVGRSETALTPLTAGLTEWSEYPELGPIGDLLASSDFASAVSVLVVQRGGSEEVGLTPAPASPGRQVRMYMNRGEFRCKGGNPGGLRV